MTDVSLYYNVHVPCSIPSEKAVWESSKISDKRHGVTEKMNRRDIRLVLSSFDDGLKLHFLLGEQTIVRSKSNFNVLAHGPTRIDVVSADIMCNDRRRHTRFPKKKLLMRDVIL